MRRVLIAAAALMLSAVPSFAGDEIMANYFGNTVISKSSMGEGHAHYKADHTFDISMTAMGMSHGTSGTWKIDENGQLCRTYAQVMPGMPNPLCTPWEAHKISDTWTMDIAGSTRTLSLVKGIQ
jgi:hypothetical protein